MALLKVRPIDPLPLSVPIVNPDGTPTVFFSRQWLAARNVNLTTDDVSISIDALAELVTNMGALVTALQIQLATIQLAIPTGGTTGQVLTKTSNDDYDTEWATP